MSLDKPVVRSPREISPRDISPRESSSRLPNAYRKRNSISSSCSKSDDSSEDDYTKMKSYENHKGDSPVSSKSSFSTRSKNKESCDLKRKSKKKSRK